MTLDEAIKHCEEVAKENQRVVDTKDVTIDMLFCDDEEIEELLAHYQMCADKHRQLAEWLKELKDYRERIPSYEAGYNDAKREIALSGEYERAYERGKADAQPKMGKWIYDKNIENWRCSKCGETPKTPGYCGASDFMAEHFKYCNHCGAKMQEVENGSHNM